jgi:hypothetical protein
MVYAEVGKQHSAGCRYRIYLIVQLFTYLGLFRITGPPYSPANVGQIFSLYTLLYVLYSSLVCDNQLLYCNTLPPYLIEHIVLLYRTYYTVLSCLIFCGICLIYF